MSGFIDWLEKLNEKDTKVSAVLLRGLSFTPGQYVPAYPYVEPFIKDEERSWPRKVHYLVASLWASHWREGHRGQPLSLGKACAEYRNTSGSSSTENRFITLLDADVDQLPHRLRQMVALLKEQEVDFNDLLQGLLYWHDDQRRTQNRWARDYYRN
jgi:CRISPR system Cascade subunit CasB